MMPPVEQGEGTEAAHKPEQEEKVAAAQESEPGLRGELEGAAVAAATMKPWEQHAGVISLPRYDYKAPSSLLHHSHSGFFITCSIKREKSATKEVMSILDKSVGIGNNGNPNDVVEALAPDVTSKRRKVSEDENLTVEVKNQGSVEEKGEVSEVTPPVLSKKEITEDKASVLSLVKLIKSGLILLIFPREASFDTVDAVSKTFLDIESGCLKPPIWCHRIFPIQATCSLNEKDLHAVVKKLVLDFLHNKQHKTAQPLKFAVGYNRRGMEEQKIFARDNMKDSEVVSMLDRDKCFRVVASAVKETIPDSAIDLKCPDISVLVELLPLSGVPDGSLIAAVSVLPQNLTSTKPRLCVKPLVSEGKGKKGRS
ncbi:unnamed protein product [Linum tenue]|uniref:THUMP domain-containing protein n=1 Tax=Linum tenue TaxID=586396 RepID=A0AAV0KMH3_9ROSI|nr:unnamed protein product [Linum tenue]